MNIDVFSSGPYGRAFGIAHDGGDARVSLVGARVIVHIEAESAERRFHSHQALQGRVGIVGPVGDLHGPAAAHDTHAAAGAARHGGDSKGLAEIGFVVGNALGG